MLTQDDIRTFFQVTKTRTSLVGSPERYVSGIFVDHKLATQDAADSGEVTAIECAQLGETYVRLGTRFPASTLQTTTFAQAKGARQQALARATAALSPEDLDALGLNKP